MPIARIGEMLYAPGEIPGLIPGKDGLVRVQRDPADVFDPKAVGSFVGKPTTNDHPPDFVNLTNFRRFATGATTNVRRGEGDQSELLLADLIWTDPDAIKAIEGGKDQISCGYEAEYEQIAPGIARQMAIAGNHVALVDEGRCGERCAIGDAAHKDAIAASPPPTIPPAPSPAPEPAPSCGCGGHSPHRDATSPAAKPASDRRRKSRDMAVTKLTPKKVKGSAWDRLRRSFASKDEVGFEEALSETQEAVEESQEAQEQAEFASMVGEAVARAIAPVVARLDGIEAVTNDLERTRDDEAAAKASAEKEAAEKAAAAAAVSQDVVAEDGNGGKAFQSFLKSKGLSEEDIAAAMKLMTTPATDSLEQPAQMEVAGEGSPDTPDGDPDGGATAPLYNAGASSQIGDSAALAAEFRDTIARAEVLAPGVKLPTYDAKAKPKATSDAICALRRKALKNAFDSADRKSHVALFVTDAAPDFSKMSCAAVKTIFTGASELAKVANKAAVRDAAGADLARTRDHDTRSSIKAINDANTAFWARTK